MGVIVSHERLRSCANLAASVVHLRGHLVNVDLRARIIDGHEHVKFVPAFVFGVLKGSFRGRSFDQLFVVVEGRRVNRRPSDHVLPILTLQQARKTRLVHQLD